MTFPNPDYNQFRPDLQEKAEEEAYADACYCGAILDEPCTCNVGTDAIDARQLWDVTSRDQDDDIDFFIPCNGIYTTSQELVYPNETHWVVEHDHGREGCKRSYFRDRLYALDNAVALSASLNISDEGVLPEKMFCIHMLESLKHGDGNYSVYHTWEIFPIGSENKGHVSPVRLKCLDRTIASDWPVKKHTWVSFRPFKEGEIVVAKRSIMEEQFNPNFDTFWRKKYCPKKYTGGWTHANFGDIGKVVHVDKEGYPTVRWARSRTATVCSFEEIVHYDNGNVKKTHCIFADLDIDPHDVNILSSNIMDEDAILKRDGLGVEFPTGKQVSLNAGEMDRVMKEVLDGKEQYENRDWMKGFTQEEYNAWAQRYYGDSYEKNKRGGR